MAQGDITRNCSVQRGEDFWEAEAGGSGADGQSALYMKPRVMPSLIVGVGFRRRVQLLRVRSRDQTTQPQSLGGVAKEPVSGFVLKSSRRHLYTAKGETWEMSPYALAKQTDSFSPVIVTFNEIWVEIIVRSGGKSGSHCCYYLWNVPVCQELLNAVNDHTMSSLKKQTFVSHSSEDQTPAHRPQAPTGSQAAPSEGFSGDYDFGLWFLPSGCVNRVLLCHSGERKTQGMH